MKYNMSLKKYSVCEVLAFLNSQIHELSSTYNAKDISNILNDTAFKVSQYIDSEELILEIKNSSKYISNTFSQLKTEESISEAKRSPLYLIFIVTIKHIIKLLIINQ